MVQTPREISKLKTEKTRATDQSLCTKLQVADGKPKHFVHEQPKDSTSWKMPEVQSFVSDPREYSIDGPICRWSLKVRGSDAKVEFMRKQTRWLKSSKEIC